MFKYHIVSWCVNMKSLSGKSFCSSGFSGEVLILCIYLFFLTINDFNTFLPLSLQPLCKWRAWLILKGQWLSIKGGSDEGLVCTLNAWCHFCHSIVNRNESRSTSLRFLFDFITERIQQQKTIQLWNFPTSRNASPGNCFISSPPVLFSTTVTEVNPDYSAARCHFSSLCSSVQRDSALARTLSTDKPESQSQGDYTCRMYLSMLWLILWVNFKIDMFFLLETSYMLILTQENGLPRF